jgi:mono/diheme cytochrome c family protein
VTHRAINDPLAIDAPLGVEPNRCRAWFAPRALRGRGKLERSRKPGTKASLVVLALAFSSATVTSAFAKYGSGNFADGYYTAAQAEAGKAVYDRTCAICHGPAFKGASAPAVSGKDFLSVSKHQKITAYYFFRFMSVMMPKTAPGSLTKEQYLDLTAYLLEVNGYRSGAHRLTADRDELQSIKIEPQPPGKTGGRLSGSQKTNG